MDLKTRVCGAVRTATRKPKADTAVVTVFDQKPTPGGPSVIEPAADLRRLPGIGTSPRIVVSRKRSRSRGVEDLRE